MMGGGGGGGGRKGSLVFLSCNLKSNAHDVQTACDCFLVGLFVLVIWDAAYFCSDKRVILYLNKTNKQTTTTKHKTNRKNTQKNMVYN